MEEMCTPDTDGESATVVETKLPLAGRLISEDAHLMAEPSDMEGEENEAHTVSVDAAHRVSVDAAHRVNVDETHMANAYSCILCSALHRSYPERACEKVYIFTGVPLPSAGMALIMLCTRR